jgi:hypothetical protein
VPIIRMDITWSGIAVGLPANITICPLAFRTNGS